mmetsp:Transcript_27884/g.52566  ORF Transcript_27884/g.52566 Transcript_27884/m.52566 type:complete len:81 (-) Transcript_27884:3034-3276(-)
MSMFDLESKKSVEIFVPGPPTADLCTYIKFKPQSNELIELKLLKGRYFLVSLLPIVVALANLLCPASQLVPVKTSKVRRT